VSYDVELESLVAEREILRTMAQYSQAVDYNLEDEWVDCFTEDGVYAPGGAVLPEWVMSIRRNLNGRDALQTFIRRRVETIKQNQVSAFSKHIPLVPLITVDGDSATVVSHFVGFGADDGVPVVRDLGRYRDTFVKCADGRWRIKERIFEAEALNLDSGEGEKK
jgi:SnoaL-like domain